MSGKINKTTMPEILGAQPDNYAGDISVQEAWRVLSENPNAVLVDVRTRAEWSFVGVADLSAISKQPTLAEWQSFPTMNVNAGFVAEVKAVVSDEAAPVLFLCRSGARSLAAAVALTAQGFSRAYNIIGGFEGDLDETRHRGQRTGWKAAGLPWIQG